jgi:hypothetical protein
MSETETIEKYKLRKDDLENHLKSVFSGQESEISVTVCPLTSPPTT